jgi:predicted transglutaminase-like cysteine proteinase
MPTAFPIWLLLCLAALGIGWGNATGTPTLVTDADIAQAKKDHGLLASRRMQAWQDLIRNNQNKPERLKLQKVNDFFNQVAYKTDIEHWGQKDYWATPTELLGTDGGDCEDYVIAKYFTLKALGVAEDKLYLTYVKALRPRQAHMVLTYFKTPAAQPLVLDNINTRILQAEQRRDLIPVYSFNGDGLWVAKQRGKGKAVDGGTNKLKNWQSLLRKMDQ